MITAILEARLEDVERHARERLPGATIVSVGRLVALQHPELDAVGPEAIREIAAAYNLPLRAIRDRPPLEPLRVIQVTPTRRALPAAE